MFIPVIISITTLPSRIGRLRPCLDSLLAGDVVPDKILLPLPALSQREQCAYEIPAFLKDNYGARVEVVAAEQDYGPGTKVLGALSRIQDPCYLIAADDDVRYRPHFLSSLLAAQRADRAASFSHHTYRTGGLTIGQGCDGFSFYSPNLRGLGDFYQKHVRGTDLFYHDDLWLSFFLFARGIAVRRMTGVKSDGLIYESVHDVNSLHALSGKLTRKQLNRHGLRRLLRASGLGAGKKFRLKAVAIYDSLITSPVRRLKRKAGRFQRGSPR
ncbi:MAG TPA: hypothetical protein VG347_22705 [Verrucomicrobiae bacterium]|nr:hypothetical protein [Verrucomicrobiae bacterium]